MSQFDFSKNNKIDLKYNNISNLCDAYLLITKYFSFNNNINENDEKLYFCENFLWCMYNGFMGSY